MATQLQEGCHCHGSILPFSRSATHGHPLTGVAVMQDTTAVGPGVTALDPSPAPREKGQGRPHTTWP